MRTVTVSEKHKAVVEGVMSKSEFVRQMRQAHPEFISQFNGYEDSVRILKNKGLLYEEVKPIHSLEDRIAPEIVTRGTHIEMRGMGLDPVDTSCPEKREQAKQKALKNLEKDSMYYLNKIAKTKKREDNISADGLEKKSETVDKKNGLTKPADTKLMKEVTQLLIKNILKEDKQILKEYVTAPDHLAEYLDYQAENNPELAKRVREAAKKLSDHIAKIEKAYLDSRENIEEIYNSIGSHLAPEVAAAFRDDVTEIFKSYLNINIPVSRQLSPEEMEKQGLAQDHSGRVYTTNMKEGRKSLKDLLK